MIELFKDISRLNSLDRVSPEKRLCKLFEEAGELAQVINKKIGRKVSIETDEQIRELICEETADTIQCILSFVDSCVIDLSFVEKVFEEDSNQEIISNERLLMKLFKYIGCLSYDFEHGGNVNEYYVKKCISKALILACYYGIDETEVVEKIKEKNIKWEKIMKL